MRVWVEYTHTLDHVDWARRHALGEVPDQLPYGLDRLVSSQTEVLARPVRPARGLARLARGTGRRLSGGFEVVESIADGGARRACDVVLCWDERTGVPAALRSRRRDEPPVATGVLWLTDQIARGPRRRVAVSSLRRAAAVWALSSAQLPLLRDLGVGGERLHYLPFGVDVDFWCPSGPSAGSSLVVGAGNDRHRDHALLVRATSLAQRLCPSARLEVVTRQAVEVPAAVGTRRAHLDHARLRALYLDAAVVSVALLPNVHVSGVTVVLEAMACGRPVVVTRTPGMDAYVEDGVTGLLVPPGDAESLAAALQSLLSDPARAQAMGEAGRLAVERGHSTQRQASSLAAILAGLD